MKIKIKRVYDPVSKEDGVRILVDRLWPRGFKKEDLKLDSWLKSAAPSQFLRKWYSHDPAKWEEFRKKYREELEDNPEAIFFILSQKGTVTLLYSAKDEDHNNAVCLKEYLESKIKKK